MDGFSLKIQHWTPYWHLFSREDSRFSSKNKLLTMLFHSVFSPLFTDSCQKGQFYLSTKSPAGRQPLRPNRRVAVLVSSSTLSGITKGLFAETFVFLFFAEAKMWLSARAYLKSANEMRRATMFPSQNTPSLRQQKCRHFVRDSWICWCLSTTPSTSIWMFYLLAFWAERIKKKHTSLVFSVRRSEGRRWCSAMENNSRKWTDFLLHLITQRTCPGLRVSADPALIQFDPWNHTRQLLVLVPVKRRSMRPALIVIISDRLPGTISNPHHLSCRQVHHRAGALWLLLL